MTSVEKRNEILGSLKVSDPSILQKVDKELDVLEITDGINSVNNLDSFYDLWKKNINKKGHKNDINSWTAYSLGLTEAKPKGEFLPFRRAFARAGFPDIDSDFDYFRRQEIYDYIIDKYGRENVGNIGTYSLLKLKSAIRRIGKALDVANAFHKGDKENKTLNEAKVKEIIETLPPARGAILKITDEDGKDHTIKTIYDAYKYCPDFRKHVDKIPNFLKYAKDLEGTISNFGIHAAGIVISDSQLCDIAPLRISKANLATQYPYEDLESMGLIKFDILAISSLTVIQKTVEMIKQNYGIVLDIKNLSLSDQKTYDLYKTGKLIGVFQCEGHGMQETMQEIAPTSFNDIMAAISLYRPGPMASIPEYCARKRGHKKVDYFHPIIEKYVKPHLEKTYGLLVFQEQIMQICNSLAGFSVTDGYVVIKGIGKKKVELISKYRKQFIEGTTSKGLSTALAAQYWDRFITPFASYGFNAAHACSYAYTSFVTAYLKANYADEFMCCYLNVENYKKQQNSHKKVKTLEKDLKRFNIELLNRDINKCNVDYEIVKKGSGAVKTQILPAIMCKGVSAETAQEIVDKRPINNLRELAYKTSNIFTRDSLKCLVEDGFFDGEYKSINKGKNRQNKIEKSDFGIIMADKFDKLRKDKKKAGKKGVGDESLFD